MTSTVILFVTLAALIVLNVPIAIALGLSSAFTLLTAGFPITSIPSILQSTVEKFTLLTIPLFVLAGTAMDEGGISKRLINVAKMFIGSVYGGLGYVMIVVALFFAAISGSGTATVAAVGSILIPAMISEGYDKSFSGALSAISGSLGTIIPPSISFVVYGMITGLSIGDLFISGFIPGILYALALCVIVFYYSRKYKWRGSLTKYTKKEKLKALGDAFWGILSPVIVLGGIYGGIFTATEAAAVASVYSIIVGMFIYKDMNFKGLIRTLKRSVATTGVIMLIVACAGVFSYVLAHQGIATALTNMALQLTDNKYVMLFVINIVFLIAGCLMDGVSAMYILLPIIIPIAQALNIDLLHLGVITVVNLSIGQVTPPVGPNLYVAADIAKCKFSEIIPKAIPFILASIVILFVLTYVPSLCTVFVK